MLEAMLSSETNVGRYIRILTLLETSIFCYGDMLQRMYLPVPRTPVDELAGHACVGNTLCSHTSHRHHDLWSVT